jgi:phenylacetate-CoA ligase
MPFIRYRTGDCGEVASEKCSCGRNLQIIKQFHGRTGEIFTTSDGRMFSPNFWCRTFMDVRLASTVRRFQIVYSRDRSIRMKLIIDKVNRPEAERILTEAVCENFGGQTGVRFDYVEDIPPQLSGKYQMVINECVSGGNEANR